MANYFFKRCLLPQAVSPLQKGFCAFSGFSVLTITLSGLGYGGLKAFHFIGKNQQNKIKESSKIDLFFDNIIEKIDNSNEYMHHKPVLSNYVIPFINGALSGIGSLFLFIGGSRCLYTIYNGTKLFQEQIKNTTECCNIMRSTIKYSIKTPVFGILAVLCYNISYEFGGESINDFSNFYHNLIKNEEEE